MKILNEISHCAKPTIDFLMSHNHDILSQLLTKFLEKNTCLDIENGSTIKWTVLFLV